MTTRLLYAYGLTVLVSAQVIAQQVANDPLSEAEAIVKAAGPIPAAPKPAQLLATHELLMEPTAWYLHNFDGHSSKFELVILYPDETFAYFETRSVGVRGNKIPQEFARPSYFLNENELRAPLEYIGKWKIDDSGIIKFTRERISKSAKKEYDFMLDTLRKPYPLRFTTQSLRLFNETSEYDLKKTIFYPKFFGTTAIKARGNEELVPL